MKHALYSRFIIHTRCYVQYAVSVGKKPKKLLRGFLLWRHIAHNVCTATANPFVNG